MFEDPLYWAAMLVFGLIGIAVIWHEKKNSWNPLRLVIGGALCIFPYFITTGWIVCVVGALLCGGLFINYE